MALPTSYLTSTKNVGAILTAIQTAQAPDQFTQAFLSDVGFKSSSDRLIIGVLKSLGFLDDSGVPKDRYFAFLDQTMGAIVLAAGIREAYADVFKLNKMAQSMTLAEVRNKFKTLTLGKPSDGVLEDMASTFQALCRLADWATPGPGNEASITPTNQAPDGINRKLSPDKSMFEATNLTYQIQIQLPVTRDQAVYDAIFSSLRVHLFQ